MEVQQATRSKREALEALEALELRKRELLAQIEVDEEEHEAEEEALAINTVFDIPDTELDPDDHDEEFFDVEMMDANIDESASDGGNQHKPAAMKIPVSHSKPKSYEEYLLFMARERKSLRRAR